MIFWIFKNCFCLLCARIYLFNFLVEMQSYRERRKNKQRELVPLLFPSPNSHNSGQNFFFPGSPHDCSGLSVLFPYAFYQGLDQKWSRQDLNWPPIGCWHCGQHLICYNTTLAHFICIWTNLRRWKLPRMF